MEQHQMLLLVAVWVPAAYQQVRLDLLEQQTHGGNFGHFCGARVEAPESLVEALPPLCAPK